MAPSRKGLRKFTSATDRSSIWSVGFCSDIYNLYTTYSYKEKHIYIYIFPPLKLVGSEDAACLNSLLCLYFAAKSLPICDVNCLAFIARHLSKNAWSSPRLLSNFWFWNHDLGSAASARHMAGGYSFKYPVDQLPSASLPIDDLFGGSLMRWCSRRD